MTKNLGVGIIGCGNISTAYLQLALMFKGYDIAAVADINMDNARAQAVKFGVRAGTVNDLLAAQTLTLLSTSRHLRHTWMCLVRFCRLASTSIPKSRSF